MSRACKETERERNLLENEVFDHKIWIVRYFSVINR
jgi:hypothetical protein